MNTHEFKFSMGQIVYTVKQSSGVSRAVCGFCDGNCYLKVKDRSVKCPDCFGRGVINVQQPIKYIADPMPLTIGQMRVVITDSKGRLGEALFDNYKPQKIIHEEYMAIETGIGSGSVHYATKLSATFEEAEAMAEKMNNIETLNQ